MRYGPGHKEEAKAKILGAVSRGFRRLGFGGIGVDGLAKEAGVTSGAFYGHFPSKTDAFRAAVVAGMIDVRLAIEALRAQEGDAWLAKFVDFYMSAKRTCDLSEACPLQSLTPDVARSDSETKAAYEAELLKSIEAMAEGLDGGTLAARRKTAIAILSMLSGSVTMARATDDPKTGAQIASAVKNAVLGMSRGDN